MEGYRILAKSYRKFIEEGKLDKESGEREIRICEFLADCEEADLYRLIDSGAFNSIIKAYLLQAMNGAGIKKTQQDEVCDALSWLFDTAQAQEVMER